MNNISELKTGPINVQETLAVLEDLKAKLLSGEIKAFVAVGVSKDHSTLMWSSMTSHTTRLEMMGAISNLQLQYASGEV